MTQKISKETRKKTISNLAKFNLHEMYIIKKGRVRRKKCEINREWHKAATRDILYNVDTKCDIKWGIFSYAQDKHEQFHAIILMDRLLPLHSRP